MEVFELHQNLLVKNGFYDNIGLIAYRSVVHSYWCLYPRFVSGIRLTKRRILSFYLLVKNIQANSVSFLVYYLCSNKELLEMFAQNSMTHK